MLNIVLKSALKKANLRDVIALIASMFGLTDLLGAVVNYLTPLYVSKGRSAVIAMVSIKADSIRKWATTTHGDPEAAVAAWRKVATAIADFIEALLPK